MIQDMHRAVSTWALLALTILAATCMDSPFADETESPAEVLSASVAPDPGGIFHTLAVHLDRKSRVVVDYRDEDGQLLRLESETVDTVHRLLLSRLHAQREYSVEVRAITATGQTGHGVARQF